MRPLVNITDPNGLRHAPTPPECGADAHALHDAQQVIHRVASLYRRLCEAHPAGIPDRHIYALIDATADLITALEAAANLPLRSPAVCAEILPLLLFARGNFPRLDRHTVPLIATAQQTLLESNTPL